MALAEQAELVVKLSLRDGISGGIRGAQGGLRRLQSDFNRTSQSLTRFGNNLRLFGVGLAGAAALAINEFAKFEDQLATINTVANVTDEQLLAIGESLKALAAETGTALPELTAAYYDLVSAGVAAKDAQLVLTNATKLAIGGLATTGETVDLLTTAINSYGLKAKEVTTVTNGFAQTIALGKITAAELASSFAAVAPVASAAGISIQELQAGYATLTAAGVPASESSTLMRAAIQALIKPSAGLQKLQARLGVNFAQIAKNKGLVTAYSLLRSETQRLGINSLELLGRIEPVSFMFSTTGKNADKYRSALKQIKNANADGGVAAQQFEKRQRTLAASFSRLRETGRAVALIFGGAMAPALKRVVDNVVLLISNNKGDIEELGTKFGEFLDEIGTAENLETGFAKLQEGFDFIGSIDWTTIKGAFQTTADIAKQAFDIFNGLPQPVKDSLVALLAVNRVTGGLATALIRDVGGIFLRSLTTINAAVVNVFGRSITGAGQTPLGPPIPGKTPPRTPQPPKVKIPAAGGKSAFALLVASIFGPQLVPELDFGNMGVGIGLNPILDESDPRVKRMMQRRALDRFRGTTGFPWDRRNTIPGSFGTPSSMNPNDPRRFQQLVVEKISTLLKDGPRAQERAVEILKKLENGTITDREALKLLRDVKTGTQATERETRKVGVAVRDQKTQINLRPTISLSAASSGEAIVFASNGQRLIIY